MGKAVYVNDEIYEKLFNEAHEINLPISQVLKAIIKNEEKLRKNQKIDKEKAEEKIEKKAEKNELKKQEKNDQKNEQKKEAKKMPEFDERKIEDLIEKILSQKEKEVERNNELKKIKTGFENLKNKFCDPSGRWCFATREDLEKFEKEQKKFVGESLEGIKKTLNEIKDNEVKEQAKAIAEEPEMLRNLRGRKWDELSLSEQEAVKNDLSQNFSHRALAETLLSCPECSLALKKRVLAQMSEEELAQASKTCVGDTCTLIKSELDERGKRKYFMRDEKGEWKPAELKLEKRKSRSKF